MLVTTTYRVSGTVRSVSLAILSCKTPSECRSPPAPWWAVIVSAPRLHICYDGKALIPRTVVKRRRMKFNDN